MSFWVVLLAAFLMAGLVLAAAMLWVAADAILNGRRREGAITVASLRRALQSTYDWTLRETLPDEFRTLLGKMPRRTARKTGSVPPRPLILN